MLIRRVNDDGMGTAPAGSYDTMPIVGKLSTGVEVNEVYTEFEQKFPTHENPFLILTAKAFFISRH